MEIEKMFGEYSIDEIKEMVYLNKEKYFIIDKSEKIARYLIQENGGYFYYLHEDFKKMFQFLVDYAKFKEIDVRLTDDFVIGEDDVIERIRENEAKRVQDIYHYYNSYTKNNKDKNLDDIRKSLAIDIQKISEFKI